MDILKHRILSQHFFFYHEKLQFYNQPGGFLLSGRLSNLVDFSTRQMPNICGWIKSILICCSCVPHFTTRAELVVPPAERSSALQFFVGISKTIFGDILGEYQSKHDFWGS